MLHREESFMLKVKKTVACRFVYPYAVCVYDSPRGKRVMCATESEGKGYSFSAVDCGDLEEVWSGPGGTMTIVPDGYDSFFVTHEFYKGFRSAKSHVSHISRRPDGGYDCEKYFDLPYLHRFSILELGDEKWLVGGTLCDSKEFKDDWSKPGRIYVGKVEYPKPMELRVVQSGITKNHGMYCGPFAGHEKVVICTGVEGAFAVFPPEKDGEDWRVEKILDCEISDIRVADLDGDGVEELVTIEGFHGNLMKVYKKVEEGYREVYRYPIVFGHPIWCGMLLGRPRIIIGYKEANSGLFVLTPRTDTDRMSMEVQMIDELEQFSNIDVWDEGDRFDIFAACSSGNVIKYELSL